MAKAFFHLGFLSILQNQSGDQADSLLSFYHLPLRLTSSSSIANFSESRSARSDSLSESLELELVKAGVASLQQQTFLLPDRTHYDCY